MIAIRNDISGNTSNINAQLGYINGLQNRVSVTENNILTNSNAILTKQPIINSENKLNADCWPTKLNCLSFLFVLFYFSVLTEFEFCRLGY